MIRWMSVSIVVLPLASAGAIGFLVIGIDTYLAPLRLLQTGLCRSNLVWHALWMSSANQRILNMLLIYLDHSIEWTDSDIHCNSSLMEFRKQRTPPLPLFEAPRGPR